VHARRKERLEEFRAQFTIIEVNGECPPDDVIANTIAMHLNEKYGRQVVVTREKRGWSP